MANVESGIRFQAKCVLCLDDFTEPRRLPCADTHVFCAKCLHHHVRTTSENGQFRCPAQNSVCSAWYPVPENGLDGIRKQFTLVEEGLTPPESDIPQQDSIICTEKGHRNERCALYCKDHKKLVCVFCVAGQHNKCKLSEPQEEAENQRAQLHKLLEEIEKYRKELASEIGETKTEFSRSDRDFKDMKDKVETSYRNLEAVIRQMKSDMLQKIEDIRNQRRQAEVTSQQMRHMENVDQLESTCSRLTGETDLFRLMDKAIKIQQTWREKSKEKIPTFSWHYSCEELQKQPQNLIGEVSSQAEIVQVVETTETGADDKISRVTDIKCQRKGRISGIIDVGDVLLTTNEDNSDITLYSTVDGKKIQNVPVPGLNHAWGGLVCLSQEGQAHIELVLSDNSGSCLHFLTLNRQWKILKQEKKQLDYTPWGLTLYKEGTDYELVVMDMDNTKIHIYKRQGAKKKKVPTATLR